MREGEYEDGVAQQGVVQRVGKRDKDADAHRPEADGAASGKARTCCSAWSTSLRKALPRPGLSAS